MGADDYTNRCQLVARRKKTGGSPPTTNRMTSFPLLLNMSVNVLKQFPSLDSLFPTLQLCLLILLLKTFYSDYYF